MTSVSSDETMPIALVVLNWNGVADTLECLASLRQSLVPIYAIVVDNGSIGLDVERIRASGLADIVIETGANLGYAEGNNVGLRYALDSPEGFKVIGVLNNDTLVDPQCFGDMAKHLSGADGRHLALAPTMLYADNPTESWFAGGVVDQGWPRHLQPFELQDDNKPLRASEWLTGCCILARAATWRHVGLFDSGYYLIFEDSDWSMRAVRRGALLYVVTRSTIRHCVSSSFDNGLMSLLGGYYFVRNGLRFEARYFPQHLLRFGFQWLVRPAPALLRGEQGQGLAFRWLGALAFATGQTGRAPRALERLAARLTH